MSDVTVVPTPESATVILNSVFTRDNLDKELWQGEILSSIIYYVYNPVTTEIDVTTFEFAVVMCQDCDLEQDYSSRKSSKQSDLLSVILYQAEDASKIRSRVASGDIARRVKSNREERYHYLEEVSAADDLQSVGLPALTIDFKKFFCVEPTELYRQLSVGGGAFRRSRLQVPYKEHLQGRVSAYNARVGLLRQHNF